MATVVPKTIGTGGDYSTVQGWEDACPANLVTADQIWQGKLKNENFTTASGYLLEIAGMTTDATRYIELTCDTGASFRDNANVQTNALRYNASNGASMSDSGGYTSSVIFVSGDVDFRLKGLQLLQSGTHSLCITCQNDQHPGLVEDCIFEAFAEDLTAAFALFNTVVRNSLFISRSAAGTGGAILSIGGGTSLYNTTVAHIGASSMAYVLAGNYGSPIVENCGLFGATAMKDLTSPANSPTYTTCYTDIASPPSGCTTTAFSTSTGAMFQNITSGSHDFRIKTGSSLIDHGTTDATNGATDIAKTTRPNGSAYDVGCWEFVQAAAGVPKQMMHLRRMRN